MNEVRKNPFVLSDSGSESDNERNERKSQADLYNIVVSKGSELLENYCKGVISEHKLKNLNKKSSKELSFKIESFIESILDLSEQDKDNLGIFNYTTFCPLTDAPKSFCNLHVKGKRHRSGDPIDLTCEIPPEFKNSQDWPKGFIPQIYHLLQDWGLLYIYLDMDPMPRTVSDFETMVIIEITNKISDIKSETPNQTYDSRMNFIKKLSLRLEYIKFLRLFYINCCKDGIEDIGKRKFRLTLEAIQKAIDGNKEYQKKVLVRSTSPKNTV